MALITSINEIKEVLPRMVVNLDGSALFSNFTAIEEKYLTKVIGEALYADLQTKYSANNLSADELKLVKHIRLYTAAQGLLDDMAANHVFYTSQGIRTSTTGNMQKAVGWEYKELKQYLRDKSCDGLEILLTYLWQHKADLALWTDSDEYKAFADLFIKTGSDFDDHYKLHQPMRTFYLVRHLVRDTQAYYLQSGFGKELVKYLIETEDLGDEEKEIVSQMKKGLAYLSIKLCCDHFNVQFGDTGFTIVNALMGGDRETEDSGRSSAELKLVLEKKRACERDGKNFISDAKRLANAYRNSGDSSEDYNEAYDAGPLKNYADPKARKSGNEKRKFFRF